MGESTAASKEDNIIMVGLNKSAERIGNSIVGSQIEKPVPAKWVDPPVPGILLLM